ncbi:EamA family transporter [Colwellia sp. MSW7]|uniref:EamA family transporter n=1 Tax=Colwellia maritima TaxID=2912588 RepID=A0ABS9X3L3_9GAMM|nr:EamA family transporter [Colwellia maritima]MCI2284813.1 EamA family transporter [Colwellia maritima]
MSNSILYLLTVLIWGSTWIAINYQLGDVAPEASVSYRFLLAAIILFVFVKVKHLPMLFSLKQHALFAAFGVCLFGMNYLLLYNAQQHINSALSCIAFSTLMLMNIINAKVFFKTHITKQVYFGGAFGLFGIVTLFWPQLTDVHLGTATFLGLGLCLLGTFSASMGNMLSIKNQKNHIPIVQANAWGMLYGAIFTSLAVVVQGKQFTFSFEPAYLTSLVYLSLFGSVIAFGCYLSLMTRIGSHKTSYANIIFPAIAVLISTVVEGFAWSEYTVIGLSFVLLGNIVVLTKTETLQRLFSFKQAAKV